VVKKIQHSVRWEAWLANAIEAWGKKNGNKGFSESVNYLLSCELRRRGYLRDDYEPGVTDTPSENGDISLYEEKGTGTEGR
jgi:hypothetical protein